MSHFNSEEECRKSIEEWSRFTSQGQIRQLRHAIEGTELDLMYYEEKGSERGIKRCAKCLEILNTRLDFLSGD